MLYKLISTDFRKETDTDSEGNYSITIDLTLQHLSGLQKDERFSKCIDVVSNNLQTGFQVDEQREKAITDFCTENEIEINEQEP